MGSCCCLPAWKKWGRGEARTDTGVKIPSNSIINKLHHDSSVPSPSWLHFPIRPLQTPSLLGVSLVSLSSFPSWLPSLEFSKGPFSFLPSVANCQVPLPFFVESFRFFTPNTLRSVFGQRERRISSFQKAAEKQCTHRSSFNLWEGTLWPPPLQMTGTRSTAGALAGPPGLAVPTAKVQTCQVCIPPGNTLWVPSCHPEQTHRDYIRETCGSLRTGRLPTLLEMKSGTDARGINSLGPVTPVLCE